VSRRLGPRANRTLVNDTLYARVSCGRAVQKPRRAGAAPGRHNRTRSLRQGDQRRPVGQTAARLRSNPATYTGLFTPIRELFAEVPAAARAGYGARAVLFTTSPAAAAKPARRRRRAKVEMHFMHRRLGPADRCHGRRLTTALTPRGPSTRQEHNRGRTSRRRRARQSQWPCRTVARKLQKLPTSAPLVHPLGQSATTLAGGEARAQASPRAQQRDTGPNTLHTRRGGRRACISPDIRPAAEGAAQAAATPSNPIVVIEHNPTHQARRMGRRHGDPKGGAGGHGKVVDRKRRKHSRGQPGEISPGAIMRPLIEA